MVRPELFFFSFLIVCRHICSLVRSNVQTTYWNTLVGNLFMRISEVINIRLSNHPITRLTCGASPSRLHPFGEHTTKECLICFSIFLPPWKIEQLEALKQRKCF